jgi:hypothetical protein
MSATATGTGFADNSVRYSGSCSDNVLIPQFHAFNTTVGATDNTKKGTAVSWENRCSGCHQTGLTLASQTRNISGTNVTEVLSGYSELNIGCGKCHGPGAQHVSSSGNPAFITNPANLTLLGVEGIRLANQVCGNCHQRGEGRATLAGMSLGLEYPARLVSGVLEFPLPGQSSIDNSAGNPFVTLNTTTAYFGAFPSAFGPTGDDSRDIYSAYRNWYLGYNFPIYVASNQHHQQWTDMEQGPHAPDKSTDTTCWGATIPTRRRGTRCRPGDDHQIRASVRVAGVDVPTRRQRHALPGLPRRGLRLSVNDVRNNSPPSRRPFSPTWGRRPSWATSISRSDTTPRGPASGAARSATCR